MNSLLCEPFVVTIATSLSGKLRRKDMERIQVSRCSGLYFILNYIITTTSSTQNHSFLNHIQGIREYYRLFETIKLTLFNTFHIIKSPEPRPPGEYLCIYPVHILLICHLLPSIPDKINGFLPMYLIRDDSTDLTNLVPVQYLLKWITNFLLVILRLDQLLR